MADDEYPAEKRLGEDLAPKPVYQPATYSEPRTGPGRWCVLAVNAGQDEVGILWTSDAGGLGFIPTGILGATRVPEFYRAFSRAASIGTAASEVFDTYADLSGPGMSAGPVHTGDLDTLGQ